MYGNISRRMKGMKYLVAHKKKVGINWKITD